MFSPNGMQRCQPQCSTGLYHHHLWVHSAMQTAFMISTGARLVSAQTNLALVATPEFGSVPAMPLFTAVPVIVIVPVIVVYQSKQCLLRSENHAAITCFSVVHSCGKRMQWLY